LIFSAYFTLFLVPCKASGVRGDEKQSRNLQIAKSAIADIRSAEYRTRNLKIASLLPEYRLNDYVVQWGCTLATGVEQCQNNR